MHGRKWLEGEGRCRRRDKVEIMLEYLIRNTQEYDIQDPETEDNQGF
jgi:hypothetical protein